MTFPGMTLDEQTSFVHGIDFGSENAVKSMKAIKKYLVVIYEGIACQILN
jgi:hypothetical protein